MFYAYKILHNIIWTYTILHWHVSCCAFTQFVFINSIIPFTQSVRPKPYTHTTLVTPNHFWMLLTLIERHNAGTQKLNLQTLWYGKEVNSWGKLVNGMKGPYFITGITQLRDMKPVVNELCSPLICKLIGAWNVA
jgi:hypothetical protein